MDLSGYHALATLPREINLVPLTRRQDWPYSRPECFGEEKNHFQLPRFKPWTTQPIAITRALP